MARTGRRIAVAGGPGLGMGDAVEIVDYGPAWPAAYERERGVISAALGELGAGVEHVGSTAVPGLAAKPIIDIMVGVRNLAEGERCIEPLEGLDYEFLGEVGIPGRLYFRRYSEGVRTHHLHMVERLSDFWERHILFRDYLREHRDVAQDYSELKVRLAAKFREDRRGYTEAKGEFIEAALAKARAVAG